MDVGEYKNLGLMNGWADNTPQEYRECVKLGHTHIQTRQYKPHEHWREFCCTICRFVYEVDSSG